VVSPDAPAATTMGWHVFPIWIDLSCERIDRVEVDQNCRDGKGEEADHASCLLKRGTLSASIGLPLIVVLTALKNH
jgi:hypothetical protein